MSKYLAVIVALFWGIASAQTVKSGFNVTMEPVTLNFGTATQLGFVLHFQTDDPDTVAFVAEVTYLMPDDKLMHKANALAMRRIGGDGAEFLWIGQPKSVVVVATEIKAFGHQTAVVTGPPFM